MCVALFLEPRQHRKGPFQGRSPRRRARPAGRSRLVGVLLIALSFACLAGCGGSSRPSEPASQPDFVLQFAPSTLDVLPGATGVVTVSVVGQTGFAGTVNVTVSGLPKNTIVDPAIPVSVSTDSSCALSLTIPGATLPEEFHPTFTATANAVSHKFGYTLKVVPDVKAYQLGDMLYLERVQKPDTVRLGLYLPWGATITELSLNDTNYVNAYDTGREIQVAFYDELGPYDDCAGCSGNWGWDPVQGGDRWVHGSPVLEHSLSDDQLYVRVRPLEWFPDNKGGGPGLGIESDVIVESWITSLPRHPRAFQVRYRIEHIGADDHGLAEQEFPAIYAVQDCNRLVRYGGAAPWTGGSVTISSLPVLGQPVSEPFQAATEHWAALVNSDGAGVTVYHRVGYPWLNGFTSQGDPGPTGSGTNYIRDLTPFHFGPGAVYQDEFYVIVGNYEAARTAIYGFGGPPVAPDPLPPFGVLDVPQPAELVSGTITVAGWAFDNFAVTKVEIVVDGGQARPATYGVARPDVPGVYPGASGNTGYEYTLNTRTLPNGAHTITAVAYDASGNLGKRSVQVVVSN